MPDLLKTTCVVLLCFAPLSACRRDQPVDRNPAAPVAATPTQSEHPGLAGHYSCAGHCAGIDHAVELRPDGRYVVTGRVPELSNATGRQEGRWAIEPAGRQLRLVPDNKGQPEQLYDILSDHEIAYVGNDSIAIDLVYTLERPAD